MQVKNYIKRYFLFILGLFFTGLGVAFARHSALGVSPISSVANVLSLRFTFFSLGNWLILWNCVLILGQIIILRRDFKIYQLLQIPLSVLFGYFTDFGMWIVHFIPVKNYADQFALLLCGILVIAFGVSLTVIANVIMNSGEAIVKAVSDKWNFEFGNVKVFFDISCVTVSVLLSLLLFNLKIVGTREGTIITALCTGFAVKKITRLIKPACTAFICPQTEN